MPGDGETSIILINRQIRFFSYFRALVDLCVSSYINEAINNDCFEKFFFSFFFSFFISQCTLGGLW